MFEAECLMLTFQSESYSESESDVSSEEEEKQAQKKARRKTKVWSGVSFIFIVKILIII